MTDTPETLMKQYFEAYKEMEGVVHNLEAFTPSDI